jgi:hypothetical protein
MILPQTEKLEGIIGTTFDYAVTFYPPTYSSLVWPKKNTEWNSTTTFAINQVTIAENKSAYKCLIENIDINPVEDKTGHWEKLSPLNLTGYKGFVKLGEVLELKVSEGVTLGGTAGTVALKATKTQTEAFKEGVTYISIFLEDIENNYYEYIDGPIKWRKQKWQLTA